MGQTEKNSVRAYVFRIAPDSGHYSLQSGQVVVGLAKPSYMLESGYRHQGVSDHRQYRSTTRAPPLYHIGRSAHEVFAGLGFGR